MKRVETTVMMIFDSMFPMVYFCLYHLIRPQNKKIPVQIMHRENAVPSRIIITLKPHKNSAAYSSAGAYPSAHWTKN